MDYGAQSGGSLFFNGLGHGGIVNGLPHRASPSLRPVASPTSALQHGSSASGSVSPLSFERPSSHGSAHIGGSYDFDRSAAATATTGNLGSLRSNSSSTNGLGSPASNSVHNGTNTSFAGSSSASSFISSPASNNTSATAPLHLGNHGGAGGGNKGFANMSGLGKLSNGSSGSRAGSFTSMGGLASVVGAGGASSQPNNMVAFSDRVRTASDHSRHSSGGRGTGQGAGGALGGQSGGYGRQSQSQSQSPLGSAASSFGLPQSYLNRSKDFDDPVEAAIHLAINGAGAAGLASGNVRSPLGIASPQAGQQQQQHRGPSAASNNMNLAAAATHLSSDTGSLSGRPPFARQSFSDGPSTAGSSQSYESAPHLTADLRHSSFPGQRSSPSPSAYAASQKQGQLQSQPQAQAQAQTQAQGTGGPTPNTGPLSASDPRTQLLASNLPYRVRWQDLKDLFRKAGTVLRADVSLSPDNRSRGYGSVLMATEEDAIKASEMLDGFTWQGRTLEVRIDRSGALVGVAGSAATFSQPGTISGVASPTPNHAGSASNSFLNVPGLRSHGLNSPASGLSTGSSPALSPASSFTASQSTVTPDRASSFSSVGSPLASDDMSGLSDFERGFMQGQLRSAAVLQQQAQAQQGSSINNQSPALYAFGKRNGSSGGGIGGGVGSSSGLNLVHRSNPPSVHTSVDSGYISQGHGWPGTHDNSGSLGHSASAGSSSVPTGIPGAAAMASWPAVPGSLVSTASFGVQAQPFGQGVPAGIPTTSYAGRVLFVGNLPFHCQWQDLKDLFRAAGNIQRADVAIGPEGRSRGFGTVLFATQEDAQNAVRLYHGFEYSGRTLKVHFDRFAAQNGPAVGTPGAPSQYTGAFAAAQPPSHVSHSSRMPAYPSQPHSHTGGPSVPQQQHQQQGRPSGAVPPMHGHNSSISNAGYPLMQPQSFSALGVGGGQGMGQQGIRQQQQHYQQAGGPYGQRADSSSGRPLGGYNSRYQQQSSHPQQLSQHRLQQQQQTQQQQQHQLSQLQQQHQQQHQQQQGALHAQRQQHPQQQYGQPQAQEQTLFSSQFSQPQQRYDTETQAGFASLHEQNEAARNLLQHASSASQSSSHSLSFNGPLGNPAAFLPSDLMSPGLVAPPPPAAAGAIDGSMSHPGRIQLPPQGFSDIATGQMSPMIARMNVPMTPGMPGFTFQAIPETPPLYPQFLNPGLGPFSPPLGTPHAAPPARNASGGAPGGPIYSQGFNVSGMLQGYTSMFPMHAARGQVPATQADMLLDQQQPPTPHWSQSFDHRRPSERHPDSMQYPRVEAVGTGAGGRSGQAYRADISRTPGASPRRPPSAGAEDGSDGTLAHLRRASDGTPGAVTPPAADGYPFPFVTGPSSALLARRASTNSPASSPLPGGPGARRDSDYGQDQAVLSNLTAQDALASTSAEELAKTIARLSVKGAALSKDHNAKRSLSMTAERSAAANAMARLRERAATPTLQNGGASSDSEQQRTEGDPSDGLDYSTSLGALFGGSGDGLDPASLASRLRLGLQNASQPGRPSPLSSSQVAVHSPGGSSHGADTPQGSALALSPFGPPSSTTHGQQHHQQQHQQEEAAESEAFRMARDTLLGVSIPSSVIEAATSGSALDTNSTPSGSLKSTPNEEGGPRPVV